MYFNISKLLLIFKLSILNCFRYMFIQILSELTHTFTSIIKCISIHLNFNFNIILKHPYFYSSIFKFKLFVIMAVIILYDHCFIGNIVNIILSHFYLKLFYNLSLQLTNSLYKFEYV